MIEITHNGILYNEKDLHDILLMIYQNISSYAYIEIPNLTIIKTQVNTYKVSKDYCFTIFFCTASDASSSKKWDIHNRHLEKYLKLKRNLKLSKIAY